jgi:hypothetical protein
LREEISEKDLEREEALETEIPETPEAAVEATEATVEALEAPHLAEDAESRIKEVSIEPPPKEQPKNAFDVMKKATAVKPTGMDGHRYPKPGHFFGHLALWSFNIIQYLSGLKAWDSSETCSVADPNPDPDPPDPHVFGPPGSGSISQRSRIRIGILLSLSKFTKKNLDFYSFVTSF